MKKMFFMISVTMFFLSGCSDLDDLERVNSYDSHKNEEAIAEICGDAECGYVDQVNCGSCSNGYVCENNRCEKDPCDTEGDTRIVSCGLNDNGDQEQVCIDGTWRDHGECDDPDECVDDEMQSVACGHNDNGKQDQLCVSGRWENDGECDDPDECVDGHTQDGTTVCGYNDNGVYEQKCVDGAWEDTDTCLDSDECADGNKQDGDIPCGYNDNGVYQQECLNGTWEDTDTCLDSDVCENDTFREIDATVEVCADGQWQYLRDTIKQWGTSELDEGDSVAFDSSNNIYVTGRTKSSMDGNTHAGNDCSAPPCSDIFLTKFSVDGTKQWTRQWGTSEDDEGRSVAIDSNDNIYVTGYTVGDLNGNTNEGSADIFITKFNTDGEEQWTRQWGASRRDYVSSAAVDSNDNIYVAGYTDSELEANNHEGNYDIFLMKFSSDGTKQWTRQWGTPEWDWGCSVAIDNSDNIYVAGYTKGSLDGNTNEGSADIFLTKYSPEGIKQWTEQWGTSEEDRGYSVAVDNSDNIYVAGYTEGSLDGNTNEGLSDIFLTKYSADGTKQWTKQWGTSIDDQGRSVAVDSNDNVYVAGNTARTLDGNINAGGNDIFFTEFKPDGTKQRTEQRGTSSHDFAYSVAIDNSDNIYATGRTHGAFDSNTNAGDGDIFLTEL